ncbi:MAG: 1-acyl-sn-glycerol-3-phosphate acyltransferase [Proteobacteria bacterium]|jgi:1-acyl-sn-glycerol-3-phosphate acyltransferase|nr:1-acyl-sn-glycerol-3-phosphate acyltransferase [Pseudomonadota bacterium]
MDKFKEIRPYHDHEIRPVIDRLITDPEFLSSIASFYAPKMSRLFPGVMRMIARKKLQGQVVSVHDVASMQDVIADYMYKMIEDTTTSLTHSGLEHLDSERSYLFVSNHRDITMDPAFVNYMLYSAGNRTVQIATGDNLLKKPFVSDLMRLNKSFIVLRSLKGRELLQGLTLLSEYMHHCIEQGSHVWIAQREGRAKNGVDKTEGALLKMLAMFQRKQPLSESLQKLHIVPVSISYEYDACDVLKAEELHAIETTGFFTKNEKSDIQSIVAGMIGFKGAVHVAFGREMQYESDDPDVIAASIDSQILENYKLRDSNYIAFELLQEKGLLPESAAGMKINSPEIKSESREVFLDRLRMVDPKLHRHYLLSYANPVISRSRNQASA